MIAAALPTALAPYAPTTLAATWLVDTLVATTVLCLVVLVIRRPVARVFGPRLAYALWAIPALRMVLPPLPAMADPVALPGPLTIIIDSVGPAAPVGHAAAATPALWLPQLLLAVWLAGVVVHVAWQLAVHRRLLRQLSGAATVRWHGPVRVVESGAIPGPVSVGLLRPMIALPCDAAAVLDPVERAVALDHELAHHRRGDLWANAAAVLFTALHWFNPVVRAAWHAFRFDQEAACDATVLGRPGGPAPITYARALAKTATGHPSAFASPMVGRRKLKERLTMLIQPARSIRRRRAGLLLGLALLVAALAGTATPVLADIPEPPAPPPAPAAPDAPEPPAPPAPPVPPMHGRSTQVIVIRDGDAIELPEPPEPPMPPDPPGPTAGSGQRDRVVIINHRGPGAASASPTTEVRTDSGRQIVIRHAPGDAMPSDAEIEAMVRTARAQARAAARDAARTRVVVRTALRHADADRAAALVDARCASGASSATIRATVIEPRGAADSSPQIRVATCGDASPALRLEALRRARAALASDQMLDTLGADARARALAEVDRAIADVQR